jgi:hypothetical protein
MSDHRISTTATIFTEGRATAPPSTETPRHTATPWRVVGGTIHASDKTGYVAELSSPRGGKQRDIDASFIVEACNSHASLTAKVAELEAALKPFAGYQLNMVGFAGGIRHTDFNGCDWVAGFSGPTQPEFKHFAAARAALDNADGGRGS